jgi:hypothetical protein
MGERDVMHQVLAFQPAKKAAQGGQRTRRRASLKAAPSARRQPGPEVCGPEIIEGRQRQRPAHMHGEKLEEVDEIAAVGSEGVRGQPALMGAPSAPITDGGRQRGIQGQAPR